MAASSSTTSSSPYKLSCELIGHTDEVQSLAIFKDGSIVSASRDETARLWKPIQGKYTDSIVMKGHSDSVCSICVVEPSQKNPTGFIITGGYDNNVCIYYPGQEQPIHTVIAHDKTVRNLRASLREKECFLSCSLDGTGKLWDLYDLQKPKVVFNGHEPNFTPWCIADLPNGCVVTGGSDKLVVVYRSNGNISHKLNGHMRGVRNIAVITESEFLTCGKDAVTKHWNSNSGLCLGTYSGHTGHIYSIAAANFGSLAVSCGKDKTVRIWRNAQMEQTIGIPADTVWSIALLPNEDFVCGSSDGVLRIFTTSASRYIDRRAMLEYEGAVFKYMEKAREKNKDIDEISLSSELNKPGKKEGDTVIVKENGRVKAYRWSQKFFQWKLVGDVIESESTLNNSGKPLHNGVQYDYVFSVDVEEGAPLLKLPYNKGEDPYVAAMKFIEQNNLEPNFVDRVAKFIMTNLQISPVLNAESQYQNPFTSSRYISNSQPSTSSWTVPPNSLAEASYIPQKYYLKLEQANVSAIHEKLKEFNAKTDNGVESIPETKIDSIVNLTRVENSRTIEEEVNNLKSLLNWPDNIVFPALDIARLVVLQQDVNKQFCANGIMNVLKRHLQKDAVVSNQMLVFRLLANLFNHEAGEQFCLKCKNEILLLLHEYTQFENKNNEVAVSTYILNLVVALNKVNDSVGKLQTLNAIFKLLEILKETEAVFRILVGLGSLITGASSSIEKSGIIKMVKSSRPVLKALRVLLDGVDSSFVPNKLLSVTRQILDMMKT